MKGFAILCVIAGHMGIGYLNYLVFAFHMPLFFIVSGYFFKNRERVLQKNAKRLLMPYLFTGICLLLLTTLVELIKSQIDGEGYDFRYNVAKWLVAMAYGSGSRSDFLFFSLPTIGAVWFLLALLWGLAGLRIVLIYIPSRFHMQSITIGIIALIGCFSSRMTWLPLSFQAGCVALVFLYIGWFINNHPFRQKQWHIIFALCISLIAISLNYIDSTNMSLVKCKLPHGLIDIAGGCAISYLLFIISNKSTKYQWGGYVAIFGKYSLVVLCFHLIELTIIPWQIVGEIFPTIIDVIIIFILKIIWAFFWILICLRISFLKHIFGIKNPNKIVTAYSVTG